MTTSERWRRVRRLLEEAFALSEAERGPFLDEHCAGDPELRRELAELLAADAEGGSRLPDDADLVAWLQTQVEDALVGVRVGPCRIVRLLGAGGMGMVYEAEQDHPRRTVALKFMRPGTGSRIERFQLEAEMLAALRHPGIVQVYGGGVHPLEIDGQRLQMPYLILEPVERASTLLEYADREDLDHDRRVQLMLDVCDAMAQVHRRGLVHRDLKPANVLVDDEGRARVIDFGIGGVRGDRDPDPGAGTARYLAPEQQADQADRMSPAADVYALGTVLDELIPNASGDLRCIVAKATARSPDQRYLDAGALAGDLRRYANRYPVAAAPTGRLRALQMFVGRHRLGVAAALLVALGLTFGVVGLAIGWQNAEAARAEAEAKAGEAEAVVEFLQRALVAAQPWHEGRDATVLEFLEAVGERIDRELADRPGVAAVLHETVGWSFHGLGRTSEAEPHLRRAVALMGEHGTATPRQELVARYRLAVNTIEFGRREEAEPELAAIARLATGLFGPEDELTLTVRDFHAVTLTALNRREEAVEIQNSLLEVSERLYGATDVKTISRRNNLVNSLTTLGRFDDAAVHAEFAVEHMRAQFGAQHPNTQITMQNLAAVRSHQRRFADAEALSREVLAVREGMLGEEHPYTIITRYWLAMAVLGQERYADALALLEPTLATAKTALGEEHAYTLRLSFAAAMALRGLGAKDEADANLRALADQAAAIGGSASLAIEREVRQALAPRAGDR